MLLFSLIPVLTHSQNITTYVGNGIIGYTGDGGLATNAALTLPVGINFDNSGNLLICHQNLIRRVNSLTKIITTVVGDTTASVVGNGGLAIHAQVANPTMVCVDFAGNLYISDYWTTTVRRVDKVTGIISRFAGMDMTAGFSGDGGPATAAKLASPTSICLDRNRNYLYIADEFNFRVRRIDIATNIITSFAGTGVNGYAGDGTSATNAQLSRSLGIAIDHSGNVYIGDWDNSRIRKVDIATGIISTVVGNGTMGFSGDGGPATNANISRPSGICFDYCDNLYFSDGVVGGSNRVRKVDAATGVISTVAGTSIGGFSGDGGPAIYAQLNSPLGICFDTADNLFIADFNNQRIRKVTFDTACNGTQLYANNVQNSSTISIYPNPVNDALHIDGVKKGQEYKVYSVVGVVMLQGKLKEGNNTIPIQSLPVGVYMVEVYDPSSGFRATKKIVKQ